MAELLSTLPGDIPGLLRRGSPVLGSPLTTERRPCVVVALAVDMATIDYGQNVVDVPINDLALDLTDATGRAHAAAWADKATTYNTVEFIQRLEAGMLPSLDERHAMDLGMRFADMTAREIDTLARLCLRLAGRSHV